MANIYHEKNRRKVCLDTETTGKNDDGTPGDHRVIEIGCVEIVGRTLTGHSLQLYLNPERKVDEEAFNIHHISDEFLATQPKFNDVYKQFYDFIVGSELIIHNAKFDVGFLNHELEICHRNIKIENICQVTDTLAVAKEMFPGQRISLDALCVKLNVDRSSRIHHGALLDAELLSEVYLAMTGGQEAMDFGNGANKFGERIDRNAFIGNKKLKIIKPDLIEYGDHISFLLGLNMKVGKDKDGKALFQDHILFGDEYVRGMNYEFEKEAGEQRILEELKNKYMTPEEFDTYKSFIQERENKVNKAHEELLAKRKIELEERRQKLDK